MHSTHMKTFMEKEILKKLASDEGIEASNLFIANGVVYVLNGLHITGTVCAVGTPHWNKAMDFCWANAKIKYLLKIK